MMTYLAIDKVVVRYGQLPILHGVDLQVGQGEMHVLLGPSGCGKTTLLRSIAGLTQTASGQIVLDGKRIDTLPPKDRGLGMVFQHYALFPNMTVRQNLAFGLEHKGVEKRLVGQKVDSALDTVSLVDHAEQMPHQLSGGQKQRVALARALVMEPKLLLLDEPLSALDAQIRKRLRDELKRIQREVGLTSILVTHDQDEALSLGDRISVMHGGAIAQTGTGPDIFYRPQDLFVAQFIGDANILAPKELARLTGKEGSGHAVIQPHAFKLEAQPGDDVIRLDGVIRELSVSGPVARYVLDIAGIAIKVETPTAANDRYLAPGEAVTISLRDRDVHLVTSAT